jgi:hypothetical protein
MAATNERPRHVSANNHCSFRSGVIANPVVKLDRSELEWGAFGLRVVCAIFVVIEPSGDWSIRATKIG